MYQIFHYKEYSIKSNSMKYNSWHKSVPTGLVSYHRREVGEECCCRVHRKKESQKDKVTERTLWWQWSVTFRGRGNFVDIDHLSWWASLLAACARLWSHMTGGARNERFWEMAGAGNATLCKSTCVSEVGQVSSANGRVPGIMVRSRSGHGRTMHDPIGRPIE